jgi:hypothetical protein
MRALRFRTLSLLLSPVLLAAGAATLAQSPGPAQGPGPGLFDTVEEDWSVVVANPDPLGVGPQITTCMKPGSDASSPFVAFDMNYREYPVFSPGGMQLQVWSSGQVLSTSTQGSALFNTTGETVTWTQRMSLSGNSISYDIDNGQSTTWGKFGQGSLLSVSFPTTLGSLNGYDPDKSASASGVTWESNFVTSLTLVQVRYYANGQLLWTDTNPRVVIGSQ